jgi:hypothetical protein
MNTSFLNRCKLLINNQSRAQKVGQALCLTAVAGCFFASPFVALAGCGNNNNNQVQANNTIKKAALVTGFTAFSQNAVNTGALPTTGLGPGSSLDGLTTTPITNISQLKPGMWILVQRQQTDGTKVTVPATIFTISNVNAKGQGNIQVAEVWIADAPLDKVTTLSDLTNEATTAVKGNATGRGLVLKNVPLKNLLTPAN